MREPTKQECQLGQKIWDYFKLNHKLKKADIILCLSSIDTLPAQRAADLYLDGWAPLIVISGKGGRFSERVELLEKISEAEMLEEVVLEAGVPKEEILLEKNSTNTNENIRYTKKLLTEKNIFPKTIISVHMPSAERRDYGTIKREWPEVECIVTSPHVPFSKYHINGFSGKFTKWDVISTLVGNVQRTMIYPREEFGRLMAEQEDKMPESIRRAYYKLVKNGYTEHLFKDDKGEPIKI